MTLRFIQVRGACEHNLKSVNVDIRRDALVVFTGVSGSGKSSLAFHTLFAEGQRRYMEALSPRGLQFFDRLKRPAVDRIDGLPPTLGFRQHSGQAHPRSLVASATELYDHLRLLFARVGKATCWQPLDRSEGSTPRRCGRSLDATPPSRLASIVKALEPGTRIMVLAPWRLDDSAVVASGAANWAVTLQARGFARVRLDGAIVELQQWTASGSSVAVAPRHLPPPRQVDVVVDRLSVRDDIETRLLDSVQTALELGGGRLILAIQQAEQSWEDRWFAAHPGCAEHPENTLPALEPQLFNFNSPDSACPQCHGLGRLQGALETALCPSCHGDRLRDAACAVYLASGAALSEAELSARAKAGWSLDPTQHRLADVLRLRLDAAVNWVHQLELDRHQHNVADAVVDGLRRRLEVLRSLGLGYLTMDRSVSTLSGGEAQRLRLAAQIGSGVVGAAYVLDEPTSGLHPRDTAALLDALRSLRDAGNSVLVVEHDETVIRAADQVIDLGPGAGNDGGHLVAHGSPTEVEANAASLTGGYLQGRRRPATPTQRRDLRHSKALYLHDASRHNLRQLSVRIPLGGLVSLSGVSGSGKSTLVHDLLLPALRHRLGALTDPSARGEKAAAQHGGEETSEALPRLEGAEYIDRVVVVDQEPIGRSPRSNPATYTGMFDDIRALFSATREAKVRGYGAARFSFNAKGGRCESCDGLGVQRIDMHFLPEVSVLCEACHGARFNPETLQVRYRGLSIADVLALSAAQACEFFTHHHKLQRLTAAMVEVGLEYLSLGRASTELSGGEAQRLKIAVEIARGSGPPPRRQRSATSPSPPKHHPHSLYVFDEPTTGLHFEDVKRLVTILQRLVDQGNSVLVIEHHLDLLRQADWLIDLGPDSGGGGGRLVAEGTPETVAASGAGYTSRYLREALAVRAGS